MKKIFLPLLVMVLYNFAHAADDIYYARCNLKVTRNTITWLNWQLSPSFIPAGTQVRLVRAANINSPATANAGTQTQAKETTIIDVATGISYTLEAGAEGDKFLEKFITKNPPSLDKFIPDEQNNIKNGKAKVGMTKEQVYIAMGPPVRIGSNHRDGNTNNLTYDDIIAANLWFYAQKKRAAAIEVKFEPSSGLMSYIGIGN